MSDPEVRAELRPDYSTRISPEPADLDSSLDKLSRMTSRLSQLGLLLAAITGVNVLFCLFLSMSGIRFADRLMLTATLALPAFILAGYFERLRKIGDVLFLEISDELQWNIRSKEMRSEESAARERPKLDVRITLRSFARASDLPLIPGKFGPAIYIAINVLIAVVVPWFYRGASY